VQNDLLFRANGLVLDGSFVVRSSASRAKAVHCRLDIVVAELTYLDAIRKKRGERRGWLT
jgi:hypothetical protein